MSALDYLLGPAREPATGVRTMLGPAVVADPADRNVYLIEIWPRAVMDICMLEQALTRHEERGLRTRERLAERNGGGDAFAGDVFRG